MLVYGCLALCTVGLGLIVYRYDMYEREPWYMLLLALMAGMLSCLLIGYFEDYLFASLSLGAQQLGQQAVLVAVSEELIKLLAVIGIAILCRSQFNDPMDGLIYGTFVGLGFGLEESLFYLGLDSANLRLDRFGEVPVRLLLHLLFGGLGGFAIGLARFPDRWRAWPLIFGICLGTAITIHALWDYWLGLRINDPLPDAWQQLIAISLMGTLTIAFGGLVVLGVRWSGEIFVPKRSKRLWGWPFSLLFRDGDPD